MTGPERNLIFNGNHPFAWSLPERRRDEEPEQIESRLSEVSAPIPAAAAITHSYRNTSA